MNTGITMQELRVAMKTGWRRLPRAAMFFMNRYGDDLKRPSVVIKSGVVVGVEKIYRRGRCAMLKYTDRSGKVWWSWEHATEYEPVRKYVRKKS